VEIPLEKWGIQRECTERNGGLGIILEEDAQCKGTSPGSGSGGNELCHTKGGSSMFSQNLEGCFEDG